MARMVNGITTSRSVPTEIHERRVTCRSIVNYRAYRQNIGRAILLGLEFLVAADIIRTVAVSPTFRSAGVLAIIVLIRTFLSMALQLELEGRWPWQKKHVEMPEAP